LLYFLYLYLKEIAIPRLVVTQDELHIKVQRFGETTEERKERQALLVEGQPRSRIIHREGTADLRPDGSVKINSTRGRYQGNYELETASERMSSATSNEVQ